MCVCVCGVRGVERAEVGGGIEFAGIGAQDSAAQRPFASTATCRKSVITTRILQLVHELCIKRIHVTKRDLFYTDVKLFEVRHRSRHSPSLWPLRNAWDCHR